MRKGRALSIYLCNETGKIKPRIGATRKVANLIRETSMEMQKHRVWRGGG